MKKGEHTYLLQASAGMAPSSGRSPAASPRVSRAQRPPVVPLLLALLLGAGLLALHQRKQTQAVADAAASFAPRGINLQPLGRPPPRKPAALPLSSHKVGTRFGGVSPVFVWVLLRGAEQELALARLRFAAARLPPASSSAPAPPRPPPPRLQCKPMDNVNHRVCEFSNLVLHGGSVYYLTDGEGDVM